MVLILMFVLISVNHLNCLYLGNLYEERWRDFPSGRVIRRFKYKFQQLFDYIEPHSIVQIWEFGHNGELISNVARNPVNFFESPLESYFASNL